MASIALIRPERNRDRSKLVLNTVSMEEAVEQAEREEGPGGSESATQAHPAQDDSDAALERSIDGYLG
jgi:hypothetical protein